MFAQDKLIGGPETVDMSGTTEAARAGKITAPSPDLAAIESKRLEKQRLLRTPFRDLARARRLISAERLRPLSASNRLHSPIFFAWRAHGRQCKTPA
jgi:hypothetical protein